MKDRLITILCVGLLVAFAYLVFSQGYWLRLSVMDDGALAAQGDRGEGDR